MEPIIKFNTFTGEIYGFVDSYLINDWSDDLLKINNEQYSVLLANPSQYYVDIVTKELKKKET